jgi:hypothetical protein
VHRPAAAGPLHAPVLPQLQQRRVPCLAASYGADYSSGPSRAAVYANPCSSHLIHTPVDTPSLAPPPPPLSTQLTFLASPPLPTRHQRRPQERNPTLLFKTASRAPSNDVSPGRCTRTTLELFPPRTQGRPLAFSTRGSDAPIPVPGAGTVARPAQGGGSGFLSPEPLKTRRGPFCTRSPAACEGSLQGK